MKPYYPILAVLVFALFLTFVRFTPALAQNDPLFINSGQSLGAETGNGVALGDLDGDGDIDAVVANEVSPPNDANQVWCNQGEGTYTAGPVIGTVSGHDVALGDLDGDDDLDAVIAGDPSNQVWINQGATEGCTSIDFEAGQSLGMAAGYSVALGDVDNDNDLDVLLAGNSNEIWLNNGNGSFTAGPTFPFVFSDAAILAHLDANRFLDVVIGDSATGEMNQVWWNNADWTPGPGTFTPGPLLPTENLIHDIAAGDLDGDSRLDLFFVGSAQNQIFWNGGSRTFTTTGTLSPTANSYAVALADLDIDGDLDGVVGSITGDPNRVWRNEGSRVFSMIQEFGDEIGLYWTRDIALADLNGDDSPDLFDVTTAEDRVWFSTTLPPFAPNEEAWQYQTIDERGDTGFQLALALDASGNPHIAYVSRIVTRYYEDFNEYLYEYRIHYARWDGLRWHNQTLRSGFSSAEEIALAVDGDGVAHIVFAPGGSQNILYLRGGGNQWETIEVPQNNTFADAEAVSVAIDSSGTPHITYAESEFTKSGVLYHALWDGMAWQIETIVEGNLMEASTIAFHNNIPHVVYAECVDNTLCARTRMHYARKAGNTWQSEAASGLVPVFASIDPRSDLVFDTQGRPHIALIREREGVIPLEIIHAYRDASGWHSEIVESTLRGPQGAVSVDVDASGNPHLFYTLFNSATGARFSYARWTGTEWQIETLDRSPNTEFNQLADARLVLDENDRLHVAYFEPEFFDLRYLSRTLNYQTHTITTTGVIEQTAMDVENAAPYISYYDETRGQVNFATWTGAWAFDPLDFVNNPVTDLAVEASSDRQQFSFYDADNSRLLYRYRTLGEWQTEVVDEAGDVGRYNQLVLVGNSSAAPRIAYWDATARRIKLARPDPQAILWHIYPNTASPPLDEDSGILSAAVLPGGDIGVAYYHAANGDLRLGIWNAQTQTWTDELIAGTGDVGRLNSLQTDGTEGVPVVAYWDETEEVIKFAYKAGATWQIEAVPGTAAQAVTSLTLELGLQSRTRARIAYITADGALNVALLRHGIWRTESIVSSGVSPTGEVASAVDKRLHLTYPTATGGLSYAFRTGTLEVDTSTPTPPPPDFFISETYNPLDACQAILDLIDSDPTNDPEASGSQRLFAPDMVMPVPLEPQGEPIPDLAIFGAMTTLFAATPEGQHYINLYRTHGAEMGQLGLNDPELLMDANGVLQNFLPGLEALVTGEGEHIIATEEMVNDVLEIWQRLAAAGSPALAEAINAELSKYNNLQDFVNMSFNDWARTIGVPPPPEKVYAPSIHR